VYAVVANSWNTVGAHFNYLFWEAQTQKDFTNFASPSDSILVFDLTEAQVRECKVIGHDALNRAELTGEQHTLIL
jgi:hypothetical protein